MCVSVSRETTEHVTPGSELRTILPLLLVLGALDSVAKGEFSKRSQGRETRVQLAVDAA